MCNPVTPQDIWAPSLLGLPLVRSLRMALVITIRRTYTILRTAILCIDPIRYHTAVPITIPRTARMVRITRLTPRMVLRLEPRLTIHTREPISRVLPSLLRTGVGALHRPTTLTRERTRQLVRGPVLPRSGGNPTFRTEINLPTRSTTRRRKELLRPPKVRRGQGGGGFHCVWQHRRWQEFKRRYVCRARRQRLQEHW